MTLTTCNYPLPLEYDYDRLVEDLIKLPNITDLDYSNNGIAFDQCKLSTQVHLVMFKSAIQLKLKIVDWTKNSYLKTV